MAGTDEPEMEQHDLEDLEELERRRGGCCGMPAPVAVDLGAVMPSFGLPSDDED